MLRLFTLLLGIGLLSTPARGQIPTTGDGLKADYYSGVNFDHLVLSRRDASIAFDWALRPPGPGLWAEYFSARWTGWLRPPASGRYIFHITVDDGMRIWLDDQLILNEWRPQPVSTFTTTIALKAGQAYRLRVEYFQEILDTRARLTWERPDVPLTSPPSSWRNLWGMAATMPGPEPIPTHYLFSRDPSPAVARPAIPLTTLQPLEQLVTATPKRVIITKMTPAQPHPRPSSRPINTSPTPLAPAFKVIPPPVVALANSGSTAQLANLAVGETVTLPELYFDQGQALLLPAARTALDRLTDALRNQPGLHLEVQGHTDNMGSAELNRQLSQQRAEVVCLYLTAHGVATAQLRPVGYGGTQPVADNTDPAQRPQNRRVVLRRL